MVSGRKRMTRSGAWPTALDSNDNLCINTLFSPPGSSSFTSNRTGSFFMASLLKHATGVDGGGIITIWKLTLPS